MNCKRLRILFFSIMLILSLAGCSSKSMGSEAADSNAFGTVTDRAPAELSKEEETAQTALPENRKLIQTVTITAETEDLDGLLTQINSQITELSGYVESQNIYYGSAYKGSRYRSGNLTIRVPAENLDSFVNKVSEVSNIVSSNKTVEDVTLQYVATESRIKALQTEEARLLELLAKAETMNDLLIIESRLTEVRTELEQVTSTLNVYDNQVEYSTIHLNISEVTEYTVTEEPTTVWGRISQGFMETLTDIGDGFVEFFIYIAVNIPYFILIGILLLAAGTILWRWRKKKKSKKAPPPQNETE